jgi:subtilisin family serine protease
MILRSLVLCVCLYTVIAYNNGKYGAHLSSLLHKQARARNLHEKYNIWVLFNEQGDKIYLPTNVAERRERNGYPVFDYAVKPEYITQTLSKTNGHLRSTSNWLNAVSLGDVTAKEIETIASLDFVLQVDVVSTFKQELPVDSEPSKRQLNYGATKDQLQQINVIAAHQAGYTGKNITIAVLDSGFRTTHNCFKNAKILARYDFINNDTIVDNEPGQDLDSQFQHGTQAFSCIAGQDPGNYYGTAFDAQFLLAKTENVRYEKIIEEDNFARAVEWAERLGAQIIT